MIYQVGKWKVKVKSDLPGGKVKSKSEKWKVIYQVGNDLFFSALQVHLAATSQILSLSRCGCLQRTSSGGARRGEFSRFSLETIWSPPTFSSGVIMSLNSPWPTQWSPPFHSLERMGSDPRERQGDGISSFFYLHRTLQKFFYLHKTLQKWWVWNEDEEVI